MLTENVVGLLRLFDNVFLISTIIIMNTNHMSIANRIDIVPKRILSEKLAALAVVVSELI